MTDQSMYVAGLIRFTPKGYCWVGDPILIQVKYENHSRAPIRSIKVEVVILGAME